MWRLIGLVALFTFVVSGCGNVDEEGGNDSTGGVTVESLELSSDQSSLPSDSTQSATIVATALDGNNAAVSDVSVNFSASGGKLTSSTATTGESGEAQVTFSAGPLSTNKVVTITATAGDLTRQLPIQIAGTSVSIDANATDVPEDGSTLASAVISLKDSGNNPLQGQEVCYQVDTSGGGNISLLDTSGAPLNDACPLSGVSGNLAGTTNTAGEINVQVEGVAAGDSVLELQGGGATASEAFKVSPIGSVFQISDPAKDPIPLYDTGDGPTVRVAGASAPEVTFATTVGTWAGNNQSVITKAVSSGIATAELSSTSAGIANIRVEEEGVSDPSTDSMEIAFTAPLAEADNLTLQANPRVVPASGDGVEYTSELNVNLETADGAPVGDAPIAFELVSTTGGGETIDPPTLLTGANGQATATFTSGTKASGTEGIDIRAYVPGYSGKLKATFNVVITDDPGSVVIGQASKAETNDQDTAYILPMSVLVSDPNGNPVENAEVTLSNWPRAIHLGFWETGVGGVTVTGPFYTETFPNEDFNENNALDTGEDLNGDGELTPKNSVAGNIPLTVTTDANGVANFDLTYLKRYAAWVDIRLRASTQVGTDQVTSETQFTLPYVDGEEENLPNSPFNGGCPFGGTANPTPLTLGPNDSDNDGNPDDSVTVTLSKASGAKSTLAGREVRVTEDSPSLTVQPEGGETNGAGSFTSLIETTGSNGTATVTYEVSCADPVNVQVSW